MTSGPKSWLGWAVRPTILLTLAGLVSLASFYLLLPAERTGVVGVRLLFDGADRGRYPNGTRFSAEDIISQPVLRELYASSEVARRAPFPDFASSFFVARSSRDLELVHRAYRARLADTSLSPVDRTRLEEEYRTRLAAAGGEPELLVGFRQASSGPHFTDEEIRNLLDGALRVWVASADRIQGVFRYDIDVPGPSTFDASALPDLELLVGLDGLRWALERQLESLDEMASVPGALGTVIGEERVSSDELRGAITDLLQLRVRPALALGVSGGMAQDTGDVAAYFEMRSAETARRRRSLASRIDGMRRTLADYSTPLGSSAGSAPAPRESTTLMPQMNDAFLDRLFALAGSANDVKFRQDLTESLMRLDTSLARLVREEAYYADLERAVLQTRGGSANGPDAARLREELVSMCAAGKKLAERLQYFYGEVSRLSLRDVDQLFETSRDFSVGNRRAASLPRIVVAAITVVLAGIGIGWALERRRALGTWLRRRHAGAAPEA